MDDGDEGKPSPRRVANHEVVRRPHGCEMIQSGRFKSGWPYTDGSEILLQFLLQMGHGSYGTFIYEAAHRVLTTSEIQNAVLG